MLITLLETQHVSSQLKSLSRVKIHDVVFSNILRLVTWISDVYSCCRSFSTYYTSSL